MVQLLENPAAEQPRLSNRIETVLREMFDNVCQALEEIDGSKLHEQRWTRDEKARSEEEQPVHQVARILERYDKSFAF